MDVIYFVWLTLLDYANIGANALRLAHYQHDEYAYELADIYGICAWAEIPLVNSMTASTHFTESNFHHIKILLHYIDMDPQLHSINVDHLQ